MTSNPDFTGTPLFDIQYLKDDTRMKHGVEEIHSVGTINNAETS